MKQTLITYKTWRTKHNPWQGNNFIGNLDPNNTEDANLIDEIHSYIDEYFNPRIIGITDEDRFLILMHARLAGIEANFFNSFALDINYSNILDMLKNIDMLSDTNTDTTLSGTNNSTVTNKRTDNLSMTKSKREDTVSSTETDTSKRTDNLKSTKSERTDTKEDTASSSETIGSRSDTKDTSNGGSLDTTRTYGADNKTDTTTYGKVDTQSGIDTTTNTANSTRIGRGVNSSYPQSVVGVSVAGIDSPVDWNYANGLQDIKNTENTTTTNKLEHGLKDTLSGTDTIKSNREARTDTEKTADTRTIMETIDTGEQINKSSGSLSSTLNEGEQSVTNTGTQDNTSTKNNNGTNVEGEQTVTNTGTQDNNQTENREHSQTGKYKKINDNSGRTDNIAIIWQQWRDLLHKTMSAYTYLFEELDSLFVSVWDIYDDCYFDII